MPPNISIFNVRQNQLHGKISLQHIPESLSYLDIKHNNFAQDVLVVKAADKWKYGCMLVGKEKFGKIVDDTGTDVTDEFSA